MNDGLDAGWPVRTPAARTQALRVDADHQDRVHQVLRDLPFGAVLKAVEAHIKGRPDAGAAGLSDFAMKLDRYAWELEREESRNA